MAAAGVLVAAPEDPVGEALGGRVGEVEGVPEGRVGAAPVEEEAEGGGAAEGETVMMGRGGRARTMREATGLRTSSATSWTRCVVVNHDTK